MVNFFLLGFKSFFFLYFEYKFLFSFKEFFFVVSFFVCLFFRERESKREHTSRGEEQREREKQVPH